MSVPEVFAGLSGSLFLGDADERDRDPGRIALAIAGGLGVGLVAAVASWILVLAPYTIVAGDGSDGLAGLSRIAVAISDLRIADLNVTVVRLLTATVTDGAFLLAFVAFAAVVARQRLRTYVTAAPAIRWRLLVVGLAMAALALAPVVTAERLVSGEGGPIPLLAVSSSAGGRIAYAFSALLLIPAAAAEELFFRGWLLRQTAAFSRRPAVMIGFTAILFAALHFDFNPDAFVTRAIMGAGFAYMTLRLGGIEFSSGVHAANNILIVLFLQPLTLQTTTPDTGFSAGSILESAALILGYLAITEAVVRLAPLRRWAGVRPEEITRPTLGEPNFS